MSSPTIDPNWQLTTPANIVRALFDDFILRSEALNKMSLSVAPELLQEIALSRSSLGKQQRQNELPQLGINHNLK